MADPEDQTPEQNQTTTAEESKPVEAPVAAPRRESRFGHTLRTILRWVIGVITLLLVGFVVASIVLYLPARNRADQASAQLATAQAGASGIQQQATTIAAQNATLSGQAKSSQEKILLLKVENDVSLARYSLAAGDPQSAKNALATTSATLKSLANLAGSQNTALGSSIPARIELVLSEIGKDNTTAASDLSILNDQLKTLQNSLFPAGIP